jgi:hypothetical protein
VAAAHGLQDLHAVTGRPFNEQATPVLVLAGMALFGVVAGLSILGVETIRSAIRDKDSK